MSEDTVGSDLGPVGGAAGGRSGGACGCGSVADDLPALDARTIPPAVRHAAILGALAGLRPGDGMVLVAPHDPVPLLATLDERQPGAFDVGYLERGPQAWRLSFLRR